MSQRIKFQKRGVSMNPYLLNKMKFSAAFCWYLRNPLEHCFQVSPHEVWYLSVAPFMETMFPLFDFGWIEILENLMLNIAKFHAISQSVTAS